MPRRASEDTLEPIVGDICMSFGGYFRARCRVHVTKRRGTPCSRLSDIGVLGEEEGEGEDECEDECEEEGARTPPENLTTPTSRVGKNQNWIKLNEFWHLL